MTIVNVAGRAMTDVTDDQKPPSTRSYLTVGLPDPPWCPLLIRHGMGRQTADFPCQLMKYLPLSWQVENLEITQIDTPSTSVLIEDIRGNQMLFA